MTKVQRRDARASQRTGYTRKTHRFKVAGAIERWQEDAFAVQLEDYFDFLGPDEIRIKGHRIGIEHVVEYYNSGYNADDIAREFPGLSLEKIYATITYYLHNRAAVDAYIKRQDRQSEAAYQAWAANPSPVVKRLRAILAEREQQLA
jgi:uncharacterized protein (DUF433 family)